MHEKRGRDAKGNKIRERIEFAAKWTFDASHPGNTPIEQIKNAGEQNETEGDENRSVIHDTVRIWFELGLDNFSERDEAAEQIGRREEIRQKINFQLRLRRF